MDENQEITADTRSATTRSDSGLRSIAFRGYQWLLLAFVLAGIIQIFLAGLGAFRLQNQGLAVAGDAAFAAHRSLGFTLGGVAVVILLLALVARPGVLDISLAVVLVLQTALLQSLLAGLADNHVLYGGLHALDGLLILAIPGYLYVRARRQRRG